jgi:hypothetical protein
MRKLVVFMVSMVMCFGVIAAFTGCTDTSGLEARIAELERQLKQGGIKGEQGPKGDTGEQGPKGDTGTTGGGLVGNDTPDKVHQLGDTVAYYHNGLKLFEITVTQISLEGGGANRTLVRLSFTPHTFIEPNDLGGFLSAQLINADGTSLNNTSSLPGPNRIFTFSTTQPGPKTLYLCINSANMYLPFAVYELNLLA